jgi:hypothetical protein
VTETWAILITTSFYSSRAVQCTEAKGLAGSSAKKGSERMSRIGNGVRPANGTKDNSKQPSISTTPRQPRRLVLLAGGEQGVVKEVLLELHGEEVSGKRLHADVQRLARQHAGAVIAAEWLGPLGWTRFLWCRA